MKEKSIGLCIYNERVNRGLSQGILCEGLCSIESLSNIEIGETIPNIFLCESLLQRLGISLDEFEIVLYDNEYKEIQARDNIEINIDDGKMDITEKNLEEYSLSFKKGNLQKQYYYQMKAVIEYQRKKYNVGIEYLKRAFYCVHPKYSDYGNRLLLSIKDIEILCMIAEGYAFIERMDIKNEIIDFLIQYIDKSNMEKAELIKIYPKIAYLCAVEEAYCEDVLCVQYCEKALEFLIEYGSTLFLIEIGEILINKYKKMKLEKKLIKIEQQIKSLKELYEEFGIDMYVTNSDLKWFKECRRKQYLLCSELIKGERITRKKSREEFINGIYDNPETLAKIESGKQNPSYDKYKMIMDRFGMVVYRYNRPLCTQQKDIIEKKDKIIQLMGIGDCENAKIEFEKLKLVIDHQNMINQQYIMQVGALLDFKLGVIDADLFYHKTVEALKFTYAGGIDILLRTPTLEESRIFNYIAIALWKMGQIENGKALYQKLQNCYSSSKVNYFYHHRATSSLNKNFLMLLEISGDYEEALEYIKMEVKRDIFVFRGDGFDFLLTELVCVLQGMQMDEEKKNKAIEKCLRIAYYISDLFLKKSNNEKIDKYYKENINVTVEWY